MDTTAPASYADRCRAAIGAAIVEVTAERVPALIADAWSAGRAAEDFAAFALRRVREERAAQAPVASPAPAPAPRADLPALRQHALRAMVDYLTAAQTEAARQHATRDLATAAQAVAEDAVTACREGLAREAAQAASDAIAAACPRGRVRVAVLDDGREIYVTCGDAGATLGADESDPRWDGVDLSGRDEGDPSSLRSLLEEIEDLQADAQRVEDCIADARPAVAAWRTACEVSR